MYVDSHCHLDFPEFTEQRPALLQRMAANDVGHALCVSVNLADFPGVLALAESDARLFASVGVHPDYPDVDEPTVERLVELAGHPKIVAVGETGLDYFRLTGDLEWQRERFRTHIRAARSCGKPLIIHTRASADDTIRIMKEEGAGEVGGVMHCFTEGWETARAAMDLGFHISFSGIVTFKNAQSLRDVAAKIPDDRLLIETDAPYLAPVPFRGRTNEPSFVRHVAEGLAVVRATRPDLIGDRTTDNFFNLFK